MIRQLKYHLILAVGIVILLFTSIVSCGAPPSQQPSPTEQPVKRPAEFEVGPLTFAPTTVMVNDVVIITASIKNTGDMIGTYTAVLSVEEQEADRKNITIVPGNSQEISFPISKTTPGTYKVAIGNSNAAMTVYEWSPYKIQYDDSVPVPVGTLSMVGFYVAGENGHIVHFTPPAKPFKIRKISVFAAAHEWDIYELDLRHVTVRIWDKEGNNQLWSQDLPWRFFMGTSQWRDIEVPDIRVDDDFYVEVVTHSIPTTFKNGVPSPGGEPIGEISCSRKGPCTPWSVIVLAFDYPQSYINSPSNRAETRSGYSYMGKPFKPAEGRLEGIRWFIRVEGVGPPEQPNI